MKSKEGKIPPSWAAWWPWQIVTLMRSADGLLAIPVPKQKISSNTASLH